MCILFVNKQMLVCNIKFCSQPCVAFSLLLNYNIYSLNLYLPIKVCISYQTCLNSCHLSEFSQQTFKLWHILTVLTCYWSWDFSWLEIFFLATFQMKGQRISQTRHRSTTPKEHHRITVSSSHWFQHCLIWFFLLLKMFAFLLHSRFLLARAFLLFSGIFTCRHISFILIIKHWTMSILAHRDR